MSFMELSIFFSCHKYEEIFLNSDIHYFTKKILIKTFKEEKRKRDKNKLIN